MREARIYKIVHEDAWRQAAAAGQFTGSAVDVQDGYIHCSTAAQVRETAARHFAGQPGLLLVELDAARLGAALRWEPSRGGALFPHVYGPLPTDAAVCVWPLPIAADGGHRWPPFGGAQG